MTPASEKARLRESARQRRSELRAAAPGFAAELARHAPALGVTPGLVIGAYAALPGEADPQLLVEALARLGAKIAFPRIAAKAAPLSFHLGPQSGLKPGSHGISEPPADWPQIRPDLLLVPLLAFDRRGHRLGYGGGYYDRTLAALRAGGSLRAIGIAYAGQEMPELAIDGYDQRLGAVLTEQGLRVFESGS